MCFCYKALATLPRIQAVKETEWDGKGTGREKGTGGMVVSCLWKYACCCRQAGRHAGGQAEGERARER